MEEYNITYVFHLGDVVEHNTEQEWEVARKAFSALDGKVPYAVARGNHDLGPGGSAENRQTLFGKYFPLAGFRKWETFGGVYDREPDTADNAYHVFGAGGLRLDGRLALFVSYDRRQLEAAEALGLPTASPR